jgi:hypothetical protein
MPLHVDAQRDRTLLDAVTDGTTSRSRRGGLIPAANGDGEGAYSIYVADGYGALLRAGRVRGLVGPGDLVAGTFANAAAWTPPVIEALSPLAVVHANRDAVLDVLRHDVASLEMALQALDLEARMPEMDHAPADVRLARALRWGGNAIGRKAADGRTELPSCIPHRIWASWAGLHRSTVTTMLNEWIFDGRVDQRGRALLLNDTGSLPGEAR